MLRRVLLAVTAAYLLVVAWITLNPAPADPHRNPLLEGLLATFASTPLLRWVDYDVVEFTANVLLFVPMGLLFAVLLGRWRWWLAFAIGAAATLTIEFVQLFLPARVSDPRDLLANTLGTLVGIGIAAVVTTARERRERMRGAVADAA
ncbi:VanZ family protein [Leifsonia sp. NPDC056824]|uniref:VanZ family protein n=1 Tax=Leifsonia sp. NPDC056824 TaxID=3345953 RepID=UPI00368B140A